MAELSQRHKYEKPEHDLLGPVVVLVVLAIWILFTR